MTRARPDDGVAHAGRSPRPPPSAHESARLRDRGASDVAAQVVGRPSDVDESARAPRNARTAPGARGQPVAVDPVDAVDRRPRPRRPANTDRLATCSPTKCQDSPGGPGAREAGTTASSLVDDARRRTARAPGWGRRPASPRAPDVAVRRRPCAAEVDVGQRVAVHDQERVVVDQRQRVAGAAGRAEDRPARASSGRAGRRPSPSPTTRGDRARGGGAGSGRRRATPCVRELAQDALDQGRARQRHRRLRPPGRQRPQAGARGPRSARGRSAAGVSWSKTMSVRGLPVRPPPLVEQAVVRTRARSRRGSARAGRPPASMPASLPSSSTNTPDGRLVDGDHDARAGRTPPGTSGTGTTGGTRAPRRRGAGRRRRRPASRVPRGSSRDRAAPAP